MVTVAEYAALRPAAQLRRLVERYVYIDAPVPPHILKPLSPRPETGISFNLTSRDPLRLEYPGGQTAAHPVVAVFGPLSHRIADIRCAGRYRAFNVLFRGSGYYRLFGVSPVQLADHVSDACDVIGRDAGLLHELLCAATDATEMAAITDRYLLSRLTDDGVHPVHEVVEQLDSSHGNANLAALSDNSGLSARQLERKFLEQIGIAAKRYARLARFRYAAHLKLRNGELSWTDVSHAAGFYDHNHLVKDFRDLVGATPSDYLRSIAIAPVTEIWSNPGDERSGSRSNSAPAAAGSSES